MGRLIRGLERLPRGCVEASQRVCGGYPDSVVSCMEG